MTFITRFAPSPTGPLHLGHAYSAMLAHDMARAEGGKFLLRIEDIDQSRARSLWEDQIYDDLAWLGITWDCPVMRQSDRMWRYEAVIEQLWERGLLYACRCNRKDIQQATAAPQEGAPMYGPDGVIYPGTCRGENLLPNHMTDSPKDCALRLDMAKMAGTGDVYQHRVDGQGSHAEYAAFEEFGNGDSMATGLIEFTSREVGCEIGDVVLARKDMGTSYHLSVVLDDAETGITDVVRGEDLSEATRIHVVLQNLLGLPTPRYHHHKLIRDDRGKRLAKRDDARAIAKYRADGASSADIRAMVGL